MKKYKQVIIYSFLILAVFIVLAIKTKPEAGKILHIERSLKEEATQVVDLQNQLNTLKKNEADAAAQKMTAPTQVKNIYKPEIASTESESSFTTIFDDVIDMAKYNGIKIYSIEYTYNPPEDDFVKNASAQYNVCLLNMQLVSDYSDLESFLKELYKYPYLVNIDKLEITPYPKNKKILLSVLQLKLYSSK
jgi:hypothetical protein